MTIVVNIGKPRPLQGDKLKIPFSVELATGFVFSSSVIIDETNTTAQIRQAVNIKGRDLMKNGYRMTISDSVKVRIFSADSTDL